MTADIDPGLMVVQGKLMSGVDLKQADNMVNEVINSLLDQDGLEAEIEKVKNKFESSTVFSRTSILNKAANLSFFELLGNAGLINNEIDAFRNVTDNMVYEAVSKYFIPSNCSTLNYISTRKDQK